MNELNETKGFGGILNVTFKLTKEYIGSLFAIVSMLLIPPFVLMTIGQMVQGQGLFEKIVTEDDILISTGLYVEVGDGIAGFLLVFVALIWMLIASPVSFAAIIISISHVKNNQAFTAVSVIKEAFSRFWGIIGGSIVFSLILFAIGVIPIALLVIIGIGLLFTDAAALAILLFLVSFCWVIPVV